MKKIGKFKIRGLLGKGGMGKIFKIEYPVTGKIGALKLLSPNPFLETLLDQATIEEMFTAEAVTMAAIRHPNVIDVLDFDRFQGRLYYTMAFYCNNLGAIIGESYETEKNSRIIPIDTAIYYIRQVLCGLSRLHFSSVIHRDIKPYNILVTDEDTVKICDFGLSKLRNETIRGHKSLKIGSPYYASPELEKNPDDVDISCDLYSTGIMLFRMLTGRLPESSKDRVSLINRDLGPNWDDFLFKATHPSRQSRYPDADSMIRDLDKLEASWNRIKDRIRSIPILFDSDGTQTDKQITLRSTPQKVPKKEACDIFRTNDLMMPKNITPNRFEKKPDGLIHDLNTHLIWQVSGTRFPINHHQARAYITSLNNKNYGGINHWRLPTVNELLSLVSEPPKGEKYCIESIFDTTQKWLWSCDRCTYITAWYVSLELGYAAYNDFSGYYHVKAVSSA